MGKFNYVFSGQVLPIEAPYALESGEGLKVGSFFGIVGNTVQKGESTELYLEGVFRLPKGTFEITFGQKLYWDSEAKQVTDQESYPLIGAATEAVSHVKPFVEVRLNGVSL